MKVIQCPIPSRSLLRSRVSGSVVFPQRRGQGNVSRNNDKTLTPRRHEGGLSFLWLLRSCRPRLDLLRVAAKTHRKVSFRNNTNQQANNCDFRQQNPSKLRYDLTSHTLPNLLKGPEGENTFEGPMPRDSGKGSSWTSVGRGLVATVALRNTCAPKFGIGKNA